MSLRARILLLVLAAGLLPLLALLWLLLEHHAETTALARIQLEARTSAIARELEDRIAGTTQLLYGLSQVPSITDSDRSTCSALLADVLRQHPQYTGLLTIRPDGELHCDSLQSGRTLQLRDRRYFQQALTAMTSVIEPAIGRLTGKRVLQIAYPVRGPDGTLHTIMLASLDMDAYIGAVLNSLPYPHANLQIWNHDGSIVMSYPTPITTTPSPQQALREFMLSRTAPSTSPFGPPGHEHIWSRAQLSFANQPALTLALSVPEADLHAPVDQQFRHALVALGLLGLLILIGGLGLGEVAIRRQANRLLTAIGRLDAGDYGTQVGAPYPRGELGQVMQGLDRLSDSLEQQRQQIRQHTELLTQQARIDPLTGLANRHLLHERLSLALTHARRTHRCVGVLMLDLDRFKTINDSLGHDAGDELLREVARRLGHCVRQDDTVARLGGDEFVVVLADMASVDHMLPVAHKILAALTQPLQLGPRQLAISTSLGIATWPGDGDSSDELLKHADTAMYRAKEQGGNTLMLFAPSMMQAMLERLHAETGLRRAIENGELRLHFQPIIDARSGQVAAAEALVRWHDPQRGLVLPDRFITIAEETGLIVPLGEWVLHEACRQALRWQNLGAGPIAVAVNLSARQFGTRSLAESIEQALMRSGCPAALLHLEITESSIMAGIDEALQTMHRLTALGVRLSIDDFGTGYSSLSQLKRLPVALLKIDRTFVRDIGRTEDDNALIDVILTLARKLGLHTVAEGVETPEQAAFLARHGCDHFQGYLYSHPCEADAFEQFVRQRTATLSSPSPSIPPCSSAPGATAATPSGVPV